MQKTIEKRSPSDDDCVLFSEQEPQETSACVKSNLVTSPNKMLLSVEVPIPSIKEALPYSPEGVHQLHSAVRVTQNIFSPKKPPKPSSAASSQKYRYADYDDEQKTTTTPYRA